MPETARFIDELRKAFGKEHIDQQVRRGLKGWPTFWAKENGIEIGTRMEFLQEISRVPLESVDASSAHLDFSLAETKNKSKT